MKNNDTENKIGIESKIEALDLDALEHVVGGKTYHSFTCQYCGKILYSESSRKKHIAAEHE